MHDTGIVAAIFDFDGTMIDSDAALVAPFIKLGVAPEQISFGHAVAPECERLGIDLELYIDTYDTNAAMAYPGIVELVGRLGRWSICSNKHPSSAAAEMERLEWQPEVALYADAFDWEHKVLQPILDTMELSPHQVVMVGDSNGDLQCAIEVGCRMVWAGWNPRVRGAKPSGEVLYEPLELLSSFPGLSSPC